MFGMAGAGEWMVILLVILILFGGKKIPELMGGLGKGVRNFKKAMSDDETAENKDASAKIEDKSKVEKT